MKPIEQLLQIKELQLIILTNPASRSLHENLPVEVVVVDDLYNYQVIQDAVSDIIREKDVDALLATSEDLLPVAGFLRSTFHFPGPSYEESLKVTDKILMKNAFRHHGLPIAAFAPLRSIERLPDAAKKIGGYPVIVKPASGFGTRYTYRIDSEEQWTSMLDAGVFAGLEEYAPLLLLESFVHMTAEYHCDGVVVDGRVVFTSVSKYFAPNLNSIGQIDGSSILNPHHPVAQSLSRLHEQAVAAVGIRNGVTHFEAYETANGFVIGEIANRPGGGLIVDTIQRQYGVDLWTSFIQGVIDGYVHPSVFTMIPTVSKSVCGWVGLPCKKGVITYVTPAHELLAVPGVKRVVPMYQVGDNPAGAVSDSSVFYSAQLEFELDSADAIPKLLSNLADIYEIRTDIKELSLKS